LFCTVSYGKNVMPKPPAMHRISAKTHLTIPKN